MEMNQHSPEMQQMIDAAAEAEEHISLDELEYYAEQLEKKKRNG